MSTMQQQSGELSAEIKKLQDGGFYTKEEADAKFGKPYTLPAATSTALGGVKLSEDFTADEDGTLHLAGGTALGPYPVGSIYQSTDAASPSALFGGTWEQIASNRVLMGTTDSSKAGFTVEAGLPNIVFNLNDNYFGESPTGTGGVSVSVRGMEMCRLTHLVPVLSTAIVELFSRLPTMCTSGGGWRNGRRNEA